MPVSQRYEHSIRRQNDDVRYRPKHMEVMGVRRDILNVMPVGLQLTFLHVISVSII